MIWGFGVILLFLLLGGVVGQGTTSSFDLNSLALKVNIKSGEQVSKVLTLSKGLGQQVKLEVMGLKGINLSTSKFVLDENAKNINVNFDSTDLEVGVYVGSIKISDNSNTYYLPVIFEIETEDVFFDINLEVPPQYSSISPGEKLVAQMKIFDLTSGGTSAGLGPSSVNLEYKVRGINGDTVSSESENVVVDRQHQLTKAVIFPREIAEGPYVFSVIATYKGSVGTASYLFNVGSPVKGVLGGFLGIADWRFIIIVAIILILFLALVILFVYTIRQRDTTLKELKEGMEEEYQHKLELINQQEQLLRIKGMEEEKVLADREAQLNKLKVLRKIKFNELKSVKSKKKSKK